MQNGADAAASDRRRRRPGRRTAPGMRSDRRTEESLRQTMAQLRAQRHKIRHQRQRQRILVQMTERTVLEQTVILVLHPTVRQTHTQLRSARTHHAGTANLRPGRKIAAQRLRRHRGSRQHGRQPEDQNGHPAGECRGGTQAHDAADSRTERASMAGAGGEAERTRQLALLTCGSRRSNRRRFSQMERSASPPAPAMPASETAGGDEAVGSAGRGGQSGILSRSSRVRATTFVARRRSARSTRSSARLACDSSTVRGPAP